ncbi:hybrid sensor histidine kinase/response regulator [Haliangium ochraceum]|uniref:histidine kinase n=1 Tax=Haliangium ochraceum (strain DSM 14365 / JCM 11303 / SMP-2) TaxID=502025 RepID=D0LT24_HALO1|nr:response regulator [Haliangium ochraceum]ACY19160.1 response regulator receiver sensor signal transduction histidine kinase [Haliangium ochraceum DSM 14365]
MASRAGRILIVDDNAAIHDDFHKILRSTRVEEDTLDKMARDLFGRSVREPDLRNRFTLDSAYQGREAAARIQTAVSAGHPYSLVFLDVRMPPGWDGLETLTEIWKVDPRVHVVLCTAYADYSWEEIVGRVGESDQILILKKPFQSSEVRQLAHALTSKWRLARARELRFAELEARVEARASELESINRDLHREMDERNRIERALRQAQRLEALGRLAAGLGHEINNPLTFMIASLEAIQGELESFADTMPDELSDELASLLRTSLVGADRIAQIVRNIKRFTRPSDEPAEQVDIVDVLGSAAEVVKTESAIKVRREIAVSDCPCVTARRADLELAFISLIEHVGQKMAANEAGDRVRVTALSMGEGDLIVEIAGSDDTDATGYSSPAIVYPRDDDDLPERRASVGLSICHAILMSIDGNIEEVRGLKAQATIRVRLPASRIRWTPASRM